MRVSYHCTSMLHQTFNPHNQIMFWFSSNLGYSNCYINQNSSLFNSKYECNLTYEAVYAINHLKHRQTFFGLFVVERIITLLILQKLIHRLFRWKVSNEYKHEIDLMHSLVLNIRLKNWLKTRYIELFQTKYFLYCQRYKNVGMCKALIQLIYNAERKLFSLNFFGR